MTLQQRQVRNILTKPETRNKVFVHDKRLLPLLSKEGLVIEKELSREIYYKGGNGRFVFSKGFLNPPLLFHWVKSGRILRKDIIQLQSDNLFYCFDVKFLLKLLEEPTFENAVYAVNDMERYSRETRYSISVALPVHNALFYVRKP